ncbi:MAG: histone deacetylase, partial [Acidimicrobiia bacterium]|nr:histone deacetylase [Acidimicrobiia bacterium]
MSLLWLSHPRFVDHEAGTNHPERPARLGAVVAGKASVRAPDAIVERVPRPATRADLEVVHDVALLDTIEAVAGRGGGRLDMDTVMNDASLDAALLAAGAGLEAVDGLLAGEADAAFCAVRPPGHHATGERSMGFCLFNNVAVTAAALRARGERVAIVDFDVHHGNGTQDIFAADADVLFVSLHQRPLYPGTGAVTELGVDDGVGTTVNVPVPPGATGALYRRAFDRVIGPAVARFAPTWLLVSAGFDGHRRDPLGEVDLSAGDYAEFIRFLRELIPAGRLVVFLEGGYDLDALTWSTGAVVAELVGVSHEAED